MNGQKTNEGASFDLHAVLAEYKKLSALLEVGEQAAKEGNLQQKAIADLAYNMKLQFLHDTAEEIAGLHPDLKAERERLEALHGNGNKAGAFAENLLAKEKTFLEMVIALVNLQKRMKETAGKSTDLQLFADDELLPGDYEGILFEALQTMPETDKGKILAKLNENSETGIAYSYNNPWLKGLLLRRNGSAAETKITIRKKHDCTIKAGQIRPYYKELYDNIMKAKNEGMITSSGWIFFTLGQLHKWINGGPGKQPSPEQNALNAKMLIEFGNERISYWTEKSLAELLGLESGEEIPGFKFSGGVNAQFFEVRFYSGVEFKGQKCKDSLLCTVKFHDEIAKLQSATGNWYFSMPEDIKRIEYVTQAGELKRWPLTFERKEMRLVIFDAVCSYIRARTPTPTSKAKPHSNKLNYAQIAEQCEIEIKHSTQLKRFKAAVAVIFDHLQRKGVISHWREYANTGSKKASGIEFFPLANNPELQIDEAAEGAI